MLETMAESRSLAGGRLDEDAGVGAGGAFERRGDAVGGRGDRDLVAIELRVMEHRRRGDAPG